MKILKEFNLSRQLELYKLKYKMCNDRQLRLKMYGLIGEERVYYELKKSKMDLICLYNIRILIENDTFQVDYVIIGNSQIIIFEVKNLMDNIHIKKDGEVERIIHRKTFDETCGIKNPISQVKEQAMKLKEYLNENNFNIDVEGIVLMANDKTKIINDSSNNNIYMYYNINEILGLKFKEEKLNQSSYNIATLLLEHNQEYNFNKFKDIQKKMLTEVYVPKQLSESDYKIYLEILKIRDEYHKDTKMPIHYIFTNKEAENLVIYKPINKEEFIKVPGFKERRYELFGKKIIKIFKKRQ